MQGLCYCCIYFENLRKGPPWGDPLGKIYGEDQAVLRLNLRISLVTPQTMREKPLKKSR